MTRPRPRLVATTWYLGGLLALTACGTDQAVAPRPADAPGLAAATGAKAPLSIAPTALTFNGVGSANAATVTARVQFAGLLKATTSDAAVATVAPASTTVEGFTAIFTVTPVGAGNCTITVTDKKGDRVTVPVTVKAVKIAFVSSRDEPSGEIYVMNADGTNPVRLTNNTFNDASPAFSPDGSRIVFAGPRTAQDLDQILLMNADGSGEVQLTDIGGDFPSFSPDGSKIIFTARTNPSGEIAVMNPDGTNLVPLTNNTAGGGNQQGQFSPDGTRIVFMCQGPGCPSTSPGIYVMNADGTNPVLVTGVGIGDPQPTFSPDGTQIAFADDPDGDNTDIYLINGDGTNRRRLTTATGFDISPSFSPDGSKIAFSTIRDGDQEIYLMNADGTNQVRVTNSPGLDGFPAFSR